MLDVSRITSGKILLQRQPTALTGLVQTAINASRGAIDAAGLTLAVGFSRRARGVGGEAGIRTLGRAFGPYNGLANRRLQPLGHLTA